MKTKSLRSVAVFHMHRTIEQTENICKGLLSRACGVEEKKKLVPVQLETSRWFAEGNPEDRCSKQIGLMARTAHTVRARGIESYDLELLDNKHKEKNSEITVCSVQQTVKDNNPRNEGACKLSVFI